MRHLDGTLSLVAAITVAVVLGGTSVAASFLPSGSVGTEQLQNLAVTNTRIANNAVGNLKLRDGAVTTETIRNGTIQAVDLSWQFWRDITAASNSQGPTGASGPAGAAGAAGPGGSAGATGAQGPAGTGGGHTILNGSGAPGVGVGNDGDFYIDTAANVLYGPKSAGVWPTPGTGLIGPTGQAGQAGQAGQDGTGVLNGSGAPGAGVGANGDFYIDTAANVLYGPKAAGAWPTPGTDLVGPTGQTGQIGPAGPGITPYSGQFSSTVTQNAGLAGDVTPITYDSTDVSSVGVTLVGTPPTASVLVSNVGRYNLQFSAQVEKTTAGTDLIYIWLQTAPSSGGACGTWTNIPESASSGRQTANGARMLMTVNVLVDIAAPTCVRLAMNSTASSNPAEMRLLAEAAGGVVPAVPSVITTIWRIG